ncbi:MAG: ABC transporter permease [Actinomycetales bacterium]
MTHPSPLAFPLLVRWLWLLPAAFIGAFLVLPLLNLLLQLRLDQAPVSLQSSAVWQVLALATWQALLSTVLAMLIGVPIAAVVARYRFPGQAVALALLTVPFVLPTVVVALAFRSVVGMFGYERPSGLLVIIAAHAFVNLAVVVRIVGSAWAHQDPRPTAAARTLGAHPMTAFRTVTMPMLRAPMAAAAAVVFIFSFTSLGIVTILGDGRLQTLEMLILRQTSVLLDFPAAAATAFLQLAVIGAVLITAAVIARRTPQQRLDRPTLMPLPHRRIGRALVLATAALSCALVLTPIAGLVTASLLPGGQFSLESWIGLGSIDSGTTRIGSPLQAMLTSVIYALIAGVFAAIIGAASALALIANRVGRLIALLGILPLGLSAATIGLGTLVTYGRPPLDLRASGLLIPLAHALVAVPLVIAVAAPALRSTQDQGRAVAATLGARPLRAFFTAYGPTLRIVMIASGGLACAVSLGEFGAASFLGRPSNPTLPIAIARLLSRPGEQSFGTAAALAVILSAVTLVLVMTIDRMAARWQGAR